MPDDEKLRPMTGDTVGVPIQRAPFGCGMRACEPEHHSSKKTMGTASCLKIPLLLASDAIGPCIAFGRPMIRSG